MTLRQILRKPFVSTPLTNPVDLTGKHMIVTGCGLGSLGYATAEQLASWGATVIATTRNNTSEVVASLKADVGDKIKAPKIDGFSLDLSDASSVKRFTLWYEQNYGDRLDSLINNAGIHFDLMSNWKEPKLSADGYEIHWRTNYLGTVQLTAGLMAVLNKTGQQFGEARVVNVISQLHNRGTNELLFDSDRTYESWQAYGLSKLALLHFTSELDRRFSSSDNLKSYCLHPGGRSGVSTNVASKGLEGHAVIEFLRKLGSPLERLFMANAQEGAQTQVYCATSPEAKSGTYYVNCSAARASTESEDAEAARRLWEETQVWIEGAQGKELR